MEIYKSLDSQASKEFEKLLNSQISKSKIEEGKIIDGKVTKITDKGIAESLSLSHWVHPYTESRSFSIPSSSVILVADVSPGLSRYYEFVLRKVQDHMDQEDATNEDIYDELLEDMDIESDIIH